MSGYSVSMSGSTSSTWMYRRSRIVRPPIDVLRNGSDVDPGPRRVRGPVARHGAQLPVDDQPDAAAVRAAQDAGALRHRVEHRLHVGRRLADHAQDLGGRRLPLQRLLRLVEQPRVLDRDHRLVRERLRERDLLVVEAPGGRAKDRDAADGAAVAQQRHEQAGLVPQRDREVAASARTPSRLPRCPPR